MRHQRPLSLKRPTKRFRVHWRGPTSSTRAIRRSASTCRTACARRPIELRLWIDEGAVVHVCGSLEGMAPGVDAALGELLGRQGLKELVAQGRYRRDVY